MLLEIIKKKTGVFLGSISGSFSWQSFRRTSPVEPNHWTRVRLYQHFYLPTCQPISAHTSYIEITACYLAFQMFLPLSLSSTSMLGFHNKRDLPALFYLLLLYHFVSLCLLFFLPHLSPLFGLFFFFYSPTPVSSLIGPRCPAALRDHCTPNPAPPTSLPCRELGLSPIRQAS